MIRTTFATPRPAFPNNMPATVPTRVACAGVMLAAAFAAAVLPGGPARADQPIALNARFAHGVMTSGQPQRNFLRIGLNGCERKPAQRTPVNVAFVIDRSGSMVGARIAQARDAAAAAVRRLDGNDIASVVAFDDRIEVLVDARPVADHAAFIDSIRQIGARGSTAIHGGVSEGAQQVKRHLDVRRLNRVVLLSDGQANVGPRRPEDFAQLGRALLAQGISVSTIGLGDRYNEDLMLALARSSDGNHTFVGEATDLVQVFNKEFDDVLAACAQMVAIDLELRPGVRVVRALSRDGRIEGQTAQFQLAQVYAATEHYVLMEVAIDAAVAAAGETDLGRVRVSYSTPQTDTRQSLESPIVARFSSAAAEVAAGRDNVVLESVIEQSVRARSAAAVTLRDQGRHSEAQALFKENVAEIDAQAAQGPLSARLQYLQQQYRGILAAPSAAPRVIDGQRKLLRQMDINAVAPGARY
ncbi:MAG: VWA domain-containing protein [Hyphomicrobiales bacterium]|nr:VWA domain-containing protein [Hyphomicrobiales bacterium]